MTIEVHDKELKIIPGSITITNLDKNQMMFLLRSLVSREVLDKRLQLLDGRIDWSSVDLESQSLKVDCRLNSKTKDYQTKAILWVKCVEREVSKLFATLYVTERKIKPDEWDFLEERVSEININDESRVSIQGDQTSMLFIIVGYKVPFMDVSNKVFALTTDVKIQERLENYEIHLLTNEKVLDDINKIYKGIKIFQALQVLWQQQNKK